MTPLQARILAFITRDRIPPSQREIQAHFGWRSRNSVRRHLYLLQRKGLLQVQPGVTRGLVAQHQAAAAA